MRSRDLVPIDVQPTEFQARTVVEFLRANDIPAESMGGMLSGHRGEAPSHVTVVVQAADVQRAEALLTRMRSDHAEIDWDQVDRDSGGEVDAAPATEDGLCMRCGVHVGVSAKDVECPRCGCVVAGTEAFAREASAQLKLTPRDGGKADAQRPVRRTAQAWAGPDASEPPGEALVQRRRRVRAIGRVVVLGHVIVFFGGLVGAAWMVPLLIWQPPLSTWPGKAAFAVLVVLTVATTAVVARRVLGVRLREPKRR